MPVFANCCVLLFQDLHLIMEKAHDVVTFLEKPHSFTMGIDLSVAGDGSGDGPLVSSATLAALTPQQTTLLVGTPHVWKCMTFFHGS